MRVACFFLLLVACGEPFTLASRYPRFTEFAGECGIREDQVLGCPRPSARGRSSFTVYDSPGDTPKLKTFAIGSAGFDGCAVTTAGDAFCFGAMDSVESPGGAPFTALAVRRNGTALCGLTTDGALTCAGGGLGANALPRDPTGSFVSLGGFVGDAIFVLDGDGRIERFGGVAGAPPIASPSPLVKLTCEDGGCAGLASDGALVCIETDGSSSRYEVEAFIDVARLPSACCGLRQLGDVVCVNPRLDAAPREFSDVRFAEIRHSPAHGVCGATVGGAGACVSAY